MSVGLEDFKTLFERVTRWVGAVVSFEMDTILVIRSVSAGELDDLVRVEDLLEWNLLMRGMFKRAQNEAGMQRSAVVIAMAMSVQINNRLLETDATPGAWMQKGIARWTFAQALELAGHRDYVAGALGKAIEAFEAAGDPFFLAAAQERLGTVLAERGQLEEARALYESALRAYVAHRGSANQVERLQEAIANLEQHDRRQEEAEQHEDIALDSATSANVHLETIAAPGRSAEAIQGSTPYAGDYKLKLLREIAGLVAAAIGRPVSLIERAGLSCAIEHSLTGKLFAALEAGEPYEAAWRINERVFEAARLELQARDVSASTPEEKNRIGLILRSMNTSHEFAAKSYARRIVCNLGTIPQGWEPAWAQRSMLVDYLSGEVWRSAEAETTHRDALVGLRSTGVAPLELARLETNRAILLQARGRWGEAEPLCRSALETMTAHGAPPLDVAKAQMLLAGLLVDRAQRREADGQVNRVGLFIERGLGDEAERLYRTALDVQREAGAFGDQDRWRTCLNLTALLLDTARLREPETLDLILEAIEVVERLAGAPELLASRIGQRQSAVMVYRQAVRIALATADDATAYDRLFGYAQQIKGRALADLMAGRIEAAPDDALHRAIADLTWREQSLLTQVLGEAGTSVPSLGDALAGVRRERAALVAQQAQAQPGQVLLQHAQVADLEAVRMCLTEDEALVDYLDLGEDVMAFVVTRKGGLVFARILEGGSRLTVALEAWGGTLFEVQTQGDAGLPSAPPALATLYELLIERLIRAVPEAKRLTFSPSGRLHRVPWAALWHGATPRYLGEEYLVSVTPTPTSLATLREQLPPPGPLRLLAVAPFAQEPGSKTPPTDHADEPARSGTRANDLEPLPGTAAETAAVAALAADPTLAVVRMGQKATRAALEEFGPAALLWLVATHGTILQAGQDVLDFSLWLADGTAGYAPLRMQELFARGLRLPTGAHVALTACSLGQVALRGEEAMGFYTGLLAAGARVVLAPLWPVSDAAIAQLSERYHAGLLAGLDATTAMQAAQEIVRSRSGWEHPYFWAHTPAGDGTYRLV